MKSIYVERVREEIVAAVSGPKGILDYLRVRWAHVFADDMQLLAAIDRPRHADLTVAVVDVLMRGLGHGPDGTHKGPKPKSAVSQLGKARRTIMKRIPEADKRGRRRGVLSPEDRAILAGKVMP